MTKKHKTLYDMAFNEVKNELPALYIDVPMARNTLRNFNKFYTFLEYAQFGIYPRFLIRSSKATADISDAISLDSTGNKLQVGYKRQDDLLDMKGRRLSKSPSFQRALEYIRSDSSWLKWVLYKVAMLFKGE